MYIGKYYPPCFQLENLIWRCNLPKTYPFVRICIPDRSLLGFLIYFTTADFMVTSLSGSYSISANPPTDLGILPDSMLIFHSSKSLYLFQYITQTSLSATKKNQPSTTNARICFTTNYIQLINFYKFIMVLVYKCGQETLNHLYYQIFFSEDTAQKILHII